jgi:hypothetical protein
MRMNVDMNLRVVAAVPVDIDIYMDLRPSLVAAADVIVDLN